ncbi:MAG: 4a-hydroxytetrahydrobiopterin dehydratase [Candidatus Paracaedibacteraceae bacterium]|nr:4a-hydroxytetrahydrobiopterin dehydratase [Candidatus Paracaedibacteraceae bacterium]
MVDKIEKNQICALLDEKKGWHVDNNGLYIEKVWEFANFQMAFSFMMRVAFLSENMNHHPEWSNMYNRVFIRLTTHESNGVSLKDINLAQQIDGILGD